MSHDTLTERRRAWRWIPSLYFAEGIPYVIVMTLSVIMYKRLGISNTDIALYTSWLYVPWVIKPLWSPFVDILKTKRFWIVTMQLVIGAAMASVALTLPGPDFFRWSLVFFWLIAFSSATHDIAADGFYMLAVDDSNQAWFVGIRSTFYRFAMIAGQGLLVMVAGQLETSTGDIPMAWAMTMGIAAALFLLFMVYHRFVLPRPATDVPTAEASASNLFSEFLKTFSTFFQKKGVTTIILFILFYRFSEAQLVKMASPFLLDEAAVGGLGLSTTEVGFVYGTVGIISLTLGGLLGGFLAAKQGLKFWLWPMVAAINLPNVVYLLLSTFLPESSLIVNIAVAVEQFGYGFGFTAFMLFMIYAAEGPHKTAHFAICTGFMALGMMIPGMISGWLQEMLGYQNFFIWILLATIPGFLVASLVDIDPEFGKAKTE
ncbi:MAG: MFS transporter [Bacteroidetes Order II. Incertae sedis bacterium]|jgi:MFS transporter, PAT family, beta-lactamase induction signal transducer AmpG|nr:MFS transporter [Bacteroidetes Order II. bacterium]MBT4053394.1 MFS transporter [Bacteroidetes Order II. bacterium]MBT4602536.1 MFS transporter [Bacteroidetes Order II. bacterium]MBT5249239.1 MFS transporter [Bacteroidetes Order II. bacterium]MBT6199134.1 MFS transporter [Bacteroidetes Order II. bacterium]